MDWEFQGLSFSAHFPIVEFLLSLFVPTIGSFPDDD